jgi:hypothetical protein
MPVDLHGRANSPSTTSRDCRFGRRLGHVEEQHLDFHHLGSRSLVPRLEIAWPANRTRLRGRRILETLALIPVSVPGTAFGVGVMFPWLRAPVGT